MRVAVGRLTRSMSASSDGVSGPWRSMVASAAIRVGESSGAGLLAHPPGGADDRETQPSSRLGDPIVSRLQK